jgi:hypothetical protein
MLRFTEFDTEPVNDVVRVFQCTNVYCVQQQLITQLSGTYPSDHIIISRTGFMKVVFTSDGSMNHDGFTAVWNLVSHTF